MSWIKIDNDIFHISSILVQHSIGSHVTINLSFDIEKNPSYYNYFVKLHEKSSKFNMDVESISSYGNLIKSIDIEFGKKMNIDFRCDYFVSANKEERREDKLNDILNPTLNKNNNIN